MRTAGPPWPPTGLATRWKEESRDAWTWGAAERLAPDRRYALRALRKSPGFTAVALLTLAIGISANTVVYTVVHAVLLAPLPYRDPARLVQVLGQKPHWGTGMPAPDIAELRAQNTAFEDVAFTGNFEADIPGPPEPERVKGSRGSANLFAVPGWRCCWRRWAFTA